EESCWTAEKRLSCSFLSTTAFSVSIQRGNQDEPDFRPPFLFLYYKIIFSHTADWADPVFRKVFKSCSGSDSAVRISNFRIIYISAWFTYIFFHISIPPIKRLSPCSF